MSCMSCAILPGNERTRYQHTKPMWTRRKPCRKPAELRKTGLKGKTSDRVMHEMRGRDIRYLPLIKHKNTTALTVPTNLVYIAVGNLLLNLFWFGVSKGERAKGGWV